VSRGGVKVLDSEARSHVVTVRLNAKENADLDKLAALFEVSKSEVLVEGMRMVRDLVHVLPDLLEKDPELADMLRDSLIPGIVSAAFQREKIDEFAGKVLIGLIKEDFFGAGRRARLALKLLRK
jgi:hypothetical protein